MQSACLKRANRVGLVMFEPLPVYPDNQTISKQVRTSRSGQQTANGGEPLSFTRDFCYFTAMLVQYHETSGAFQPSISPSSVHPA
jgi:hypothetical protein